MKRLFQYIAIFSVLLVTGVYLIFFLKNSGSKQATEYINVPRGASVSSVTDSLAKHDLIRSKFLFRLAARFLGTGSKLQPGSFQITGGLSNTEIITRLVGSEFAILFEATFPEGSNIRRIASIAKEKLGLDSALFIKTAHDTAFIHSLGIPREAKTAEGYLFPDTYRFYLMMTPQELVKRMVGKWKETALAVGLNSRRTTTQNLSLHQLMTLASIVEAEARLAVERDTIAGVYSNRLKIGMKLDADPTVQYGLGLSRPITHNDLLKPNPYNTYFNVGLPPGPICNPGKPAIIAALNPAHHDKLFFVARGDGSGGHYFSHTSAEQSKMIRLSNRNERE
ncbi:MAG: endolytic transglycosylase MltG [bacterium]